MIRVLSENRNIETPVVSVSMITYNHELFINQAIEGILMQKCNFRYELIIGDDCSTDKTTKICLEYVSKYPEIIFLPLETNLGMMANFIRTLQACTGKYIALNDGDDYWTDPLKLQKQVDFLEENNDYSICFHNSFELNEANPEKSFNYCSFGKDVGFSFTDLLSRNFIPTNSVVFRNNLHNNFFPAEFSKSMFGDWYLHLLNAQYGKAWYINRVMGVHRITATSIWTPLPLEKQLKYIIDSFDYFKCTFRKEKDKIQEVQINYIGRFIQVIKEKKMYKEFFRSLKIIVKYYAYRINKKINSFIN